MQLKLNRVRTVSTTVSSFLCLVSANSRCAADSAISTELLQLCDATTMELESMRSLLEQQLANVSRGLRVAHVLRSTIASGGAVQVEHAEAMLRAMHGVKNQSPQYAIKP